MNGSATARRTGRGVQAHGLRAGGHRVGHCSDRLFHDLRAMCSLVDGMPLRI